MVTRTPVQVSFQSSVAAEHEWYTLFVMRYRCLVLDHDDTTVDSSPYIHHPAHIEQIRTVRPELEPVSLLEWLYIQSDPGFAAYMHDVLELTPEEMETCSRIWRSYVDRIDPEFFPGMAEFLGEFHDSGGIITVVTHSEADIVRRNYDAKAPRVEPDAVIGWSDARGKHKPHPWPVQEIMRRFKLNTNDLLVVDDQMPGITMATAAGVDSAGVGWGNNHPVVKQRIRDAATVVVPTVTALRAMVMGRQ